MSRYPQLSLSAYENTMELFLSEYPNGEIHKHKRCVDAYHSSRRSKKRNEKKKGLIIESDDSGGDVDSKENSSLNSRKNLKVTARTKFRLYIILLITYGLQYFCILTAPKDKVNYIT